MKCIVLISLLLSLTACCQGDPVAKRWQEVQMRNIDRCEQEGGFPIKSAWDNHMTECQKGLSEKKP